ncbi:hypothetical protein A3C23_04520 [Candidatus Roizmanbacteria bacterium RIFCSPHIGHO2_02_FULL_37_13b]|uniref:Uncharacterized protein n=1 Tax=Candidatus Roizmanbacteria bacterium RIFCSPLOWO2_02_FULL_36_11 TaxID=1802071 RepID=A0A1F7JHA4_9BACT|nr:MAG: hypothetical protein A3C23_04520 [Candidatus Roizmanbacteria bacterium RIFCSPHIGHO2_02_FULL_37_13b]OGK54972.1 MAG: hypothetical protein A3H78_00665 [Candidatus Roizmanbacteria bacterium RIFCSPLOWO2_02_FULL_36_11]
MENQPPQVPNSSPLPSNLNQNSAIKSARLPVDNKKKLLILIIVILAIVLGVIVFAISRTQKSLTKAQSESELAGNCNMEVQPPLPCQPGCCPPFTGTPGCTAPEDGKCKPKGSPCATGSCWECRYPDGLKMLRYVGGQWVPCDSPPTQPPPTAPPPPTSTPIPPTSPPLPTLTLKPLPTPTPFVPTVTVPTPTKVVVPSPTTSCPVPSAVSNLQIICPLCQ